MNLQLISIVLAITVGIAVSTLIIGFRMNSRKAVRAQELDRLIEGITETEISVQRQNSNAPKPKTWSSYWYNLAIAAGQSTQDATRLGMVAIGVAVLGALIGFFGWPRDILGGIGLPVIGLLALSTVLKHQGRSRLNKMERQLPGLLSGMRANLQASMTAQQALFAVIEDTPLPLREELITLREEIEVGVSLDNALSNFSNRVPSDELRFMVASMRIAILSGADLNPLLKTIEDIVTKRSRLNNKLSVAVSSAQPTIWIAAGMIPAVFAFTYFSNKSAQAFWITLPGILCGLAVAGLYALSLFIVRKQIDRVRKA
jgi:tight adherence protein B